MSGNTFSNRVTDNWNMLPASCANCSTITTFKKHLLSAMESEAVKFTVCRRACCGMLASVNSVNKKKESRSNPSSPTRMLGGLIN